MRSPVFRLAMCLGLLALAACDKKKSYPTEGTGMRVIERQDAPATFALQPAPTVSARFG